MLHRSKFTRVGPEHDAVLSNLYQHYIHDMSEWLGIAVQADGRFAYDTRLLWEGDFAVFLATLGDVLAGFAVVGSGEAWTGDRTSRDVKDFFVLRAHRHRGIAAEMARHLWTEFPATWIVRVLVANKPAVPFWRRAIQHQTRVFDERRVSDRDREWIHFRFDNSQEETRRLPPSP